MLRVGDEVISVGKLFQTLAPATGNARSPTVESLVRGTDSSCVDAERKPDRPDADWTNP